MIRIAHMYSSMRKGGGAERSILSILRGLDPARFESFLILNDRKQPEHDLSDIEVLPPRCAKGEKPWWAEWRYALDVAHEVRRRKIGILHSHSETGHDRLAIMLGGMTGAAVIRTLRGVSPRKNTRTGTLARLFDIHTASWTVISPGLIPALETKYKVPREKITIIPNGINLEFYGKPSTDREIMRRKLGVSPDELLLLSAGRLAKVKDYPTILEALAKMRDNIGKMKLLIVGEGPERTLIEEKRKELHLEDIITLLGYREDVPDLLAAADVFVMASIREGFGRAAAEAMAAGCPVIGTDVPGLRFVLDDGNAGVVVPLRSPEKMAEALQSLIKNEDLRRDLGKKGRDRAWTIFSDGAMVQQYQTLYERVMKKRGANHV